MNPGLEYNTFDELLDNLRREGVESEGVFTLNPARARELLKQFQLPDPALYALHITSFLVGAGATRIEIDREGSSLRFRAAGAHIEDQDLKSPFSVLLSSSAPLHLRELAFGLNALLGQKKAEAQVSFGPVLAIYKPDRIEVTDCPQLDHLTILAKAKFKKRPGKSEIELLRDSFRLCHIPIAIDGEEISSPELSKPHDGLEVHLANDNYPLQLSSAEQRRIVKPMKAPFSALLHVNRHRSALRIVHLGRSYAMPLPWSVDLPGWQVDVVVNSHRFQKDLSQQTILADKLYENLTTSLRVQLDRALELLLSVVPPMTGCQDLADDVVAVWFQKDPQRALAYQQKLVAELGLKNDSLEKGRALYRLSLMQLSSGGPTGEAAKRHGWNILSSLNSPLGHEPEWSLLSAELDYSPRSHQLSLRCREFVDRSQLPTYMKEKCCRWLVNDHQMSPTLRAWYCTELAQTLLLQERFQEAKAAVQQSLTFKALPGFQSSDQFEIFLARTRGELAVALGQLEEAVQAFGQQLTVLSSRNGQHSLTLGLTLERLSLLLNQLGKKKQAREYQAWSRRLI